jgi:hypothetical protein
VNAVQLSYLAAALALLAAAEFATGTPSAAAEPEPRGRREAQRTRVVFQGSGAHAGEVSRLFEAIVRASRNDVDVVFVDTSMGAQPSNPEPALVVILEADDETSWRLSIQKDGRLLRRDLGSGISEDAAVVEAAALAAAQATLALLDAPNAEIPEWTPSEPPSVPESPADERPAPDDLPSEATIVRESRPVGRWFLGAGYDMSILAAEAPFDSGVRGVGGFAGRAGFSLALEAAYAPWLEVDSEAGRFGLVRTSFAATVGFHSASSPYWGGTLSALLELRDREQGIPDDRVAASPARRSAHWGAAPRLFVGLNLTPNLDALLSAGADWIEGSRYVTPSEPLLELYPIRPRASVGLLYQFGQH